MSSAASPRKAKVICLGVATLDQIFRVDHIPPAPAKIGASEFIVTGGGMAANAAVAVQRLGGEAQYWGRVGDDEVGDHIVRLLKLEHVNVDHVHRLPGLRSKTATILVDTRGERLMCSAPSQGYPSDASWLPLNEVKRVDAVYADSRWKPGAIALFDAAFAANIPSVFDADAGNPKEVLIISQRATHSAFSEPMLTSLGWGPPRIALPRAFGGNNVLCGVTLGKRGMMWFDGKTVRHLPAQATVSIDTLAAGDAWRGALTLALAERQSLQQALQFAMAAASIKCSKFGGRVGIPSRAETDALISSQIIE